MIPNLTKDMINLMQQVRKRIRAEFGVDLRLSQMDLLDKFQEWCGKSKDERTQLLYGQLMKGLGMEHMLAPVAGSGSYQAHPADAPKAHKSGSNGVYRGQKILIEVPPEERTQKTERVYRGQVIA